MLFTHDHATELLWVFLQYKDNVVKEKLALIAFVDQVFETPPHERTIPFSAIASRTHLPLDQVRYALISADCTA